MAQTLIAVDIGNSRIKFGRFESLTDATGGLPAPTSTFDLETAAEDFAALAGWLVQPAGSFRWYIGSVNHRATVRLGDWLASASVTAPTILTASDLPLVVRLDQPDRVGIDRLLGAVAAIRLRKRDRAAIVIDLGSAITVDSIDADGAFLGGAILPGISMSARALYRQTDQLPLVAMSELDVPPAALGRSTVDAMRSGLFWGAVGGMKELLGRLAADHKGAVDVFITGGAAPSVARLVHPDAQHVPHLVLAGIALVHQSPASSLQPRASK
jgi:type III pantothenate kinase